MGTVFDRGYVPSDEGLVQCIAGAPWNAIDHIANMHSKLLIRETADLDPDRAWIFNVEHYRMQDRNWAKVDRALLPDEHGAVKIVVLHADVDPLNRVCQACGTTVGTGRFDKDDLGPLAPWARPLGLGIFAPFGALPA